MIGNQLALKPFLTQLAVREKTSYDAMMSKEAREMASIANPDEYARDEQFVSARNLAQVVRLAPADTQEIQATLSAAGVDARISQVFVGNMTTMAMALDPVTSVGLSSSLATLVQGAPALPQSSVVNGELQLKPALEQTARTRGLSGAGLIELLAYPYQINSPVTENQQQQADSTVQTASLFRLNAQERQEMESSFRAHGLNPRQVQEAVAGVVMNAVGLEPTLRGALDAIFFLQPREKPLNESCIVAEEPGRR